MASRETAQERAARYKQMQDQLPPGMFVKCENCGQLLLRKDLERSLWVCRYCNYHFRLTARQRIAITADKGSFREIDAALVTVNPLDWPGYEQSLEKDQRKTGQREAIITGDCTIGGYPVVLGVTCSFFRMGSMGSVVGERVARAAERALERRVPLIMISGSGGGARMQEGLLSLMQMAKTAGAIGRLRRGGQLYISVLTHPTMAGVYASWAGLGDIILAEPGAMVGFAGQRVVANTQDTLDPAVQTVESQFRHGMIDLIVPRGELRGVLETLVSHAYAAPWRRGERR